jgi:hypothetical protein
MGDVSSMGVDTVTGPSALDTIGVRLASNVLSPAQLSFALVQLIINSQQSAPSNVGRLYVLSCPSENSGTTKTSGDAVSDGSETLSISKLGVRGPGRESTPLHSIDGIHAPDHTPSSETNSPYELMTRKPVFTSSREISSSVGHVLRFQVAASGNPAPSLSVTGSLPKGVTFNAAIGVLSGTPMAGSIGRYTMMFSATNPAGTTNQSFTLNLTSH